MQAARSSSSPRTGIVVVGVAAAALAGVVALTLASRAGLSGPRSSAPAVPSRFAGVTLVPPTSKPAFTLTDTAGRPFDFQRDTAGRVALLYFGYTNCPDICPVHLAQIAAVLRQRPDLQARVRVVFVTVDPERDTAKTLRAWLDHFDAGFVGLTGSPSELDAAQRAAGVVPAVREGSGGGYTVIHAAQVLAYAPDGRGYTVYPFGTRQSDWAHDLPVLAAISPSEPGNGARR